MMVQRDVVVIGAGPAGAALAVKLTALGLNCLVVAKPRPRLFFEGMSERSAALLDAAGLHHAHACLRPPGLRHACWNGQETRHNLEHLVERQALDHALIRDLHDHGIAVTQDETAAGDGRFVCEARGRAAPAAHETLFRSPASVAVGRLFQTAPGADETAVSPFADGWIWTARRADGLATVQFTLDADHFSDHGKADLTRLHETLCRDHPHAAALLGECDQPVGPAYARDCGSYLRATTAGPNGLKVGDAACALDPLSGQGVFLALSNAACAAAIVNTCLRFPDDASLAVAFYQARVEAQFFEKTALARDFYRLEQRWPDRPFWRKRRDQGPAPAAPTPPAAFSIQDKPVLDRDRIVLRPVIVTPRHPMGVWRLDEVPVVQLDAALREDPHFSADRFAARFHLPEASVHKAVAWLHHVKGPTP